MSALANKTNIQQEAKKIATLRTNVERRGTGNDFQIIKNLLKAMETVTAALSLPKFGSSPLFLGLSIATIGIHSSESETGIIGPSFTKVVNALSNGICATLIPEADLGRRQMLTMLTMTSYAFLTCLATQTAGQGVGRFSNEMEKADLNLARFFSFELVLKLMRSSAVLQEGFKIIIEACGGNKSAQQLGAPILAQIGHLLMILAGSDEGKKAPENLISEETKYLIQGIAAAQAALAKNEDEDFGEYGSATKVALQQLRIALEENNEEDFMRSLNSLLESLGTSLNALMNDIQQLRMLPNLIAQSTERAQDDESLTGIINVI